jgi:hypothetical protein
MKLILFFSFLNCTIAYSQTTKCCLLIDSILHIPQIKKLLELDSIKDKNSIRIIQPPNSKFLNCSKLYKINNQFISLFNIHNIPYDLNTGNFRDIIISKINCTRKKTIVDVYLSNYRWNNNTKNRWHFTITFINKDKNLLISEINYALWD